MKELFQELTWKAEGYLNTEVWAELKKKDRILCSNSLKNSIGE